MLSVLVAAAALTTVTPVAPKGVVIGAPISRACGYWRLEPTDTTVRARPQRLDKLPAANMEHMVLRTDENGCSKAVIVRENVNGDGRFASPR